MQADSRVGKRRASQILARNDESPRSNPESYTTHFRRTKQIRKRKDSSTHGQWKIVLPKKSEAIQIIGSNNESEFVIDFSNEKEATLFQL